MKIFETVEGLNQTVRSYEKMYSVVQQIWLFIVESQVPPDSSASAVVQRSQIGQLDDFVAQPTSSNRIAPILHSTSLHPKSCDDLSIFSNAESNVPSLSILQNRTVYKAPSTAVVNRWSTADNVKTTSKNGKSSLDDLVVFPLRPARQTLKTKGQNDFDDLLK